jgi:hypothetical protein
VTEEVGLRISEVLKLAKVSAGIKDLKAERAYTPENDPRRKWMAMQAVMAEGAADSVQRSEHSVIAANGQVESLAKFVRENPRAADAVKQDIANAQTQSATAQQELDSAIRSADNVSDAGSYINKMEEELKRERYDAIDVSFEISSAQPLANPYVVVVAQFHAPDAPKGTAQNWIYAEAMERLDAQPQKFHVKRGGFPRGYELQRFQVHVYDRGREVASTVAPDRADLTSSEAYDYMLIEHLAAHKGKNATAVVALGNLPADLRQKLPPGDISRTFYAKVNKVGGAEGVFTDEKCTDALEEGYTASVIRNMRFLPALEKGKAVDGVARIKLADASL